MTLSSLKLINFLTTNDKWLTFSGKAQGAIGVWKNDLTVPLFVPIRILGEHHFQQNSSLNYDPIQGENLHGKRAALKT